MIKLPNQNIINKIIWILFYIFLFIFLLYNSFSYLDPDLGWHLKVGEEIWNEKKVPDLEYYNYTLEGKKWVDHEWLLNLTSYAIFSKLNYLSLSIFFALILLVFFIILNNFILKTILSGKHLFFLILPIEILGLYGIAPHSGVRMQEITILYLLLLFIIIYKYNKDKDYNFLFLLLPLFFTWSNLHAGFLIGIFILFFWIGVKLLELIIKKYSYFSFIDFKNVLNLKQIFIFFTTSLLVIGVTFFTPYGFKLYSFLSEYTDTYYLTHIQEWTPVYYFPIIYQALIFLAISATAFLIHFFYSLKNKEHKINLWYFSLFVLFFYLSLKSKRHFPLYFVSILPYLIYLLYVILDIKNLPKFKLSKYLNLSLMPIFIILSIYYYHKTNFTNDPFNSEIFCQSNPCAAVQFLKNSNEFDNLNIFNYYGWGGHLLWTYPERKIFIDGRLPQYKFAGQTMLEEYNDFFDEKKMEQNLLKYNIKLVLFSKQTKIKLNWFEKYFLGLNEEKANDGENLLINHLHESKNWKIIFENDNSILFAKMDI